MATGEPTEKNEMIYLGENLQLGLKLRRHKQALWKVSFSTFEARCIRNYEVMAIIFDGWYFTSSLFCTLDFFARSYIISSEDEEKFFL